MAEPLSNAAVPLSLSARAWATFAILFALMIVNYVDRQVVVALLPHFKQGWSLSDTQLAALVSIVPLAISVFCIPLSILADRWSIVNCIVVMALVWSGATIACALAVDYSILLALRGVVGLGEAAYGAAGAALLSRLFPASMRSTVFGVFLGSGLVGSVLGVVVGGVMLDRAGWQAAFFAAGVPGLVLAALFAAVARSPTRAGANDALGTRTPAPMRVREYVRSLLGARSALYACAGGGLQLVSVAMMYAWLPSFFNRAYALAPADAAWRAAVFILISGAGAVAASLLADALARRHRAAKLRVAAGAAVLTTLVLAVAFGVARPGSAQIALIAVGSTVMAGTIGPIPAVVADVSRPALRATALAILAVVQNVIGLGLGPMLVGMLADRYGLSAAMAIVPACSLLAMAAFLAGARTYEADIRRVASDDRRTAGIEPLPIGGG